MKRLLSVDFDFFFPSGEHGPDAMLWDWGHREIPMFINDLWTMRAASFLGMGRDLPGLDPEWKTFWSRVRVTKGATLYISESHADAADPRVAQGITEVWSYDAHHDCGYGTRARADASHVYCDTWLGYYVEKGVTAHVRYPRWKRWAFDAEPTAASRPASRTFDDGAVLPKCARVFVCRSGAWVPSWLDDQWAAFIQACPITKRVVIRDAPTRTFDPAEVDRIKEMTAKARGDILD